MGTIIECPLSGFIHVGSENLFAQPVSYFKQWELRWAQKCLHGWSFHVFMHLWHVCAGSYWFEVGGIQLEQCEVATSISYYFAIFEIEYDNSCDVHCLCGQVTVDHIWQRPHPYTFLMKQRFSVSQYISLGLFPWTLIVAYQIINFTEKKYMIWSQVFRAKVFFY